MLSNYEDKINTIAEDYGMDHIMEEFDLTAFAVVKALEEAGLIDVDQILSLNTDYGDFSDD